MRAREEGEDKGTIVQQSVQEGVGALCMSAFACLILCLSATRKQPTSNTYTGRIDTDSESSIIVKDNGRYAGGAARVGAIQSVHVH